MVVCIDTNAYAFMERKREALCDLLEYADRIIVSVTVLGELFAGFEMGKQREKNIHSLKMFILLPGVDIVQPSLEIAERYGVLVKQLRSQGTPIPTNDIWIAATALETGARLVTYDAHFQHVPGLIILSP